MRAISCPKVFIFHEIPKLSSACPSVAVKSKPEPRVGTLTFSIEVGAPVPITKALAEVVRAHGATALASGTGIARQALYKMCSLEGNPSFKNVSKLLAAIGLEITGKIYYARGFKKVFTAYTLSEAEGFLSKNRAEFARNPALTSVDSKVLSIWSVNLGSYT